MSISVQEVERLQRSVENAQRDADRAAGAKEQLLKQLHDEYGCATIQEAKAKLAEMEEDIDTQERRFEKSFRSFEEKWNAYTARD